MRVHAFMLPLPGQVFTSWASHSMRLSSLRSEEHLTRGMSQSRRVPHLTLQHICLLC